ncbi:ParB N-terminal domain-containing protein [Halorarum salinum]|uniref:Uncharacterized protein n=1 Tax=Halorarum salinum TaxID=2743089 RepID=A0A7D5QES7_9EURY|nr:hypothetical protein [Halobaculum salinum]QLG64320.1 hypothetical protein HUG12_21305 [Halobaculum salinum]
MSEQLGTARLARAVAAADDSIRRAGRRLLEREPALEPHLLAARDAYARGYVRARAKANAVRYDAPVVPYRLVHVDPADVESAREFTLAKFRLAGTVVGGDWDLTDARFADMDVYRAYVAHFEEGVPWEETAFYDRVVREMEAGRVMWDCTSEAEFRERCRRLDELYDCIAEHGYRSQEELSGGGLADPISSGPRLKIERLNDEIAVHVARDGELLFEDGRNRLSIAKVQGLETVPVRILRRHERWQAIRDAYVRGDPAVREYGDHPDVRYLDFGGG